MNPRALVDVTQFVNQPAGTGIQRTIVQLAKHWPATGPDLDVGFQGRSDGRYAIVPLGRFHELAAEIVARQSSSDLSVKDASRELQRNLSRAVVTRQNADEIPTTHAGYVLPEPTMQDHVLDAASGCAQRMGRRAIAIVYDNLPQTHPGFFGGSHQGGSDRYYLTVAGLESVAFISGHAREDFEQRIRRSTVPNGFELPLGADGLGTGTSPVPPSPEFVVPGTLEPRKRHEMILEAFEMIWSRGYDWRLRFLGAPGWLDGDLLRRFRRRADEEPRFEWRERVSDDALRRALLSASAALYVSDAEGYGLPAMEALSLGCPVVVSARLPAVRSVPDGGQIRLDTLNTDAIARAVETLADPATNEAMRRAILGLELPTWKAASERLAEWMGATLAL